ncbi:hypothetical protein [Elizabethkingia anophelis]|nr:hypothetical protein [Elizabethkingia anophelis]MCT3721313.1 hypothetical protein [Elizabethkingia anophelis]MCT3724824.1 hypothetical protein [Elizabethkingia anophelis]MCT3756782.1 hypothetical protein [Elizabethkingia anophelis]MCT3777746.1 hypothetical protein [Elizabethkingia anophelis]MCT3784860.1 hypothetical protein [Elizabethkingia anophelis]
MKQKYNTTSFDATGTDLCRRIENHQLQSMKPEPLTTKEELSQNLSQILSEQEKAELDFEFYLNELEEFFMNDFKETEIPEDDHPIY